MNCSSRRLLLPVPADYEEELLHLMCVHVNGVRNWWTGDDAMNEVCSEICNLYFIARRFKIILDYTNAVLYYANTSLL